MHKEIKALRRDSFVLLTLLFFLGGCGTRPPATIPSPSVSARPASPELRFRDVAQAAGLNYRWEIPGPRPITILQSIGNGCAFLDFNHDGNLDILLIGTRVALFQGDGKGHFTDVSRRTGLSKLKGRFLGCATGDWNNDGWEDLYVSGYRTGVLLKNNGGKTFDNVTQAMGVKPLPWGTSCTFGDYDNDGFLDLYIANYLDFGPQSKQLCTLTLPQGSIKTGCGPESYPHLKGVVLHNEGGKRFTDVTKKLGFDQTAGAALGGVWADFDGSRRLSLAVANDEQPGDLFVRGQNGKFKNVGRTAGVAFASNDVPHSGMGLDWGDYNNNGKLDLFVATFFNEPKELYHNDGDGLFSNVNEQAGLAEPTRMPVAFGCKFFDADNDGWLDLIIANGHVADNVADYPMRVTPRAYRQASQLFRNQGGPSPRFDDYSLLAGPDITHTIVGRGLAVGDYDNDGKMDVLIVDSEGAPLLLHNETPDTGHWLSLRLIGAKSNRDGFGATVLAQARGGRLMRYCHTDGSYLSASDPRVHFGLARATRVTVTVKWLSGHTDVYKDLAVDQIVTLQENQASPSDGKP